jgi:acetylornithine deacetylase
VVTEPTELEVVVAHRGFVWAEIAVTGRAAHGSRPHLGVDAIVKSRPILTALGELDVALGELTHPLLGRGSVHASLIEGGSDLATYPARCVIGLERRTLPGDSGASVEAELRSLLDSCRAGNP